MQMVPNMNIESAQYLASGSILAVIDGQQMTIPNDPGNRHYQVVMAWGTPAPWVEPPPPVPQIVSRFQARAALHIEGLLSQIEAMVAQADPLTQMAWQDATEFHRDSPTLNGLATQMGMTGAQLDDLFRAAAQIKA